MALFLPDAELSVIRGSREPSRHRGHGEIGGVLDQLAPLERTLHTVLAQEVRVEDGVVRGEVAMCAHHVRRLDVEGARGDAARAERDRADTRDVRDGEDFVIFGRYFDRFARGADGRWRYASRRLEVGWTEVRAVRLRD